MIFIFKLLFFLLLLVAILNKIFMIDIDLAQYIAICLMVFYYFFLLSFLLFIPKRVKKSQAR